MRCENCGKQYYGPRCFRCIETNVSVGGDSIDQLVEAASRPSLATLFKRGKDSGLLKPVKDYGGSSV